MLARDFNSAKASVCALEKRTLLVDSKNQRYYVCKAYPVAGFWVVAKWDIVNGENLKRTVAKCQPFYIKDSYCCDVPTRSSDKFGMM